MTFNSVGQYSANHRAWDHVGNILPNLEWSEGVRPHAHWQPAKWLPVQFFEKHYENWYVIMAGKPVACDPEGALVPAGLKLLAEGIGGVAAGDVVTYTANDVTAGTINVTTGSAVTTAELTDSGSTRGYTLAEINAAGFLGVSGDSLTISAPVGVAPYGYLKHPGGDGVNPAQFNEHNYNMQHQVAVLCDYVIELPLVPAEESAEALSFSAAVSGVATASAVGNLPVAKNTQRTEIEFSGTNASSFVNEVASASDVTSAGDWHIDLDTGVVTVFFASGTPSASIDYFHYASAPASVSKFASAVGDLKAGDLITFDENSNFRVANATSLGIGDTSSGDESANIVAALGLLCGQVLERETLPRGYLDRVRTAYNPAIGTDATGARPAYLGQLDQMPGSATGGAPANVHYAGAADTVVRINLIRF